MTFKKTSVFFSWSTGVECDNLFSYKSIMFYTINPRYMNKFPPKLRIKVIKIQQASIKMSGGS